MKDYCNQNNGDCQTCSLKNYGRDCQNNPISPDPIISKLKPEDLSGFTGSERFFKHPLFRKCVHTEGVQFLIESAGCNWLIDKILSVLYDQRTEEKPFWKIEMTVKDNKTEIVFTGEDSSAEENIIKEHIERTDFPLDKIVLWACENEIGGYTILLPSEY